MRQAGILAAAGIYALDHHISRLKEDHDHAMLLAQDLEGLPGVRMDIKDVETNIIIFDFNHPRHSIPEFLDALKKRKVLALATRSGIRFVTHKDIGDEDIEKAVSAFRSILG